MAQKEKIKTINLSYPGGYPALKKQAILHSYTDGSKVKVKGLKGGYASGKTYFGVAESLIQLCETPNNIGLFGRLTMDEIRRTLLPVFYEMCPSELIISQNKNEQYIQVHNVSGRKEQASKLFYIALDDAKGAKDKIKSMNLGFAFIDQLEEITEDVFFSIMGRLRNPNGRRQLMFSANPEGHNWIWKRWVKNQRYHKDEIVVGINAWQKDAPTPTMEIIEQRAEMLNKNPKDLLIKDFPEFVQYTDNPYLPIDYLLNMLSWPEKLKNRYVFGQDDAFEGLIYPEYEEKIHIIPDVPVMDRNLIRVIAMDYGKRNPTCVLFMDVDHNGNVYVVDEIYFPEMSPGQIKLLIRAKNRDRKVKAYVADPSIWRSMEAGTASVGDSFLNRDDESGWAINWNRANNEKSYGINTVATYLRNDHTGNSPNVYFLKDKTPNLVEEIMDYRYKDVAQSLAVGRKKNEPEEPRKWHDHAMDTLRYGLTWIKEHRIKADQKMDYRMKKLLKELSFRHLNREVRPGMVR